MSIKTNLLTTCEYEKCAQGVTNELTTWHLANQLTHLFVLTLSWSGGYTYDDVISIYRQVFPTHMYCTTAKNVAWGAVTFVKYVNKYFNNYRKYQPDSILILPLHDIHSQVSRWSNFFQGGHTYLSYGMSPDFILYNKIIDYLWA